MCPTKHWTFKFRFDNQPMKLKTQIWFFSNSSYVAENEKTILYYVLDLYFNIKTLFIIDLSNLQESYGILLQLKLSFHPKTILIFSIFLAKLDHCLSYHSQQVRSTAKAFSEMETEMEETLSLWGLGFSRDANETNTGNDRE